MGLKSILSLAVVASTLLFNGEVIASHLSFGERVREHTRRMANVPKFDYAALEARSTAAYRYFNSATSKYFVKSMPDIPFDLGELYAGQIPIDATKNLFMFFQPKTGAPVDEVTIWLNGGPGCSSLEGWLQENGRFRWLPGTLSPTENAYAWTNLTNMLWVEQPVGTGFSQGPVTATSEEEIAQDFIKFFANFEKLFGISNYKIYVTGESYAGRYVPYISAAMLNEKNKQLYDLSGALVFDPVIGSFEYTQEEVTVVPFVQANENLFNFNQSFLSELEARHESCGYKAVIDKYLQFPPPGNQPVGYVNQSASSNCDVFDAVNNAAFDPNPCFNIYEINEMCPIVSDVLGFPTELVQNQYAPIPVYFDRPEVKKAIHAPQTVAWAECAVNPVFIGNGGPQGEGDTSADPIQHVLPQVIEATNRVLVSNGDYDMIIITNGTLLSIQNMTWGGQLGFQQRPATPIIVTEPDTDYPAVFAANGAAGADGPQGQMGIQHFERGLMWAETFQSGHMQPQFQSRVTYQYLEWLLGHRNTL